MKRSPIKKVRSKPRPGRAGKEEWDATRKFVYERDGSLCHHCHVLEHAYGKSFVKPCPAKPKTEAA